MAEKKETFVINLRIDNQAYPITIRYEEEEDYRAAERQINDRLNLYRTRFPGLVKEQYLNMILLDMSVRLVKAERRNDIEPYRAAMENLTAEILSTLGEKQDS